METTENDNPKPSCSGGDESNPNDKLGPNSIVNEPDKRISAENHLTYKRPKQDVECIVKNEIKQMIFLKVSEEAAVKSLQTKAAIIENKISNMTTKAELYKTQKFKLEKEANVDEERIRQYESVIVKTGEMIDLLKQHVKDVFKQLEESKIDQILNQCMQQYDELNSLSKGFKELLKCDKNEQYKKLEEDNLHHFQELNHLKSLCSHYEKEVTEKKKLIEKLSINLEKSHDKKLTLEKKYNIIKENTKLNLTVFEDQISKQTQILEKLHETQKRQNQKLDDLTKRDSEVTENLSERVAENKSLEDKVGYLINDKENIITTFGRHTDDLEDMKLKHDKNIEILQQKYNECSNELDINKAKLQQLEDFNSNSKKILEKSNLDYITDLEERDQLSSQLYQQQNRNHAINILFITENSNHTSKKEKFVELQIEERNLLDKKKAINAEISIVKDATYKTVAQHKSKYDAVNTEQMVCLNELKKKKEYALENAKYLQEKLNNVRTDLETSERHHNNEQEEFDNLNKLIASKEKMLKDANVNLENFKKKDGNAEMQIKSIFKSPNKECPSKKVKFNETLSFKSFTESSDGSSQVPESAMARLFEDSLLN